MTDCPVLLQHLGTQQTNLNTESHKIVFRLLTILGYNGNCKCSNSVEIVGFGILYFVDRASRRTSSNVFISLLYMFRATQCSSSGEPIVSIHHLVHITLVDDCLVCRSLCCLKHVEKWNKYTEKSASSWLLTRNVGFGFLQCSTCI